MTAFMGSTATLLFPSNGVNVSHHDTVDTMGRRIERELMDLVEENQLSSRSSLTSFIASEFEEAVESPNESNTNTNMKVINYGRASAATFLSRKILNTSSMEIADLYLLIHQTITRSLKHPSLAGGHAY